MTERFEVENAIEEVIAVQEFVGYEAKYPTRIGRRVSEKTSRSRNYARGSY